MPNIINRMNKVISEIAFKKVIRKGKIVKKPVCPPGFKAVGKKCVKMSGAEKRKRSLATKKSQKKIQAGGKKTKLLKSRAKSMRKRAALIPQTQPPNLDRYKRNIKTEGNMSVIDKIDLYLNEQDAAYKKFFEKMLAKYGVSSPDELGDKKKAFFDEVDKKWKAEKETD